MANQNELLYGQARQALEQMKYEIASQFGVELGAERTARENGAVGGEMTKRLIAFAQASLASKQ